MEYKNYKKKYTIQERSKIELYQADCMDMLIQIPDKYYNLCICDPPYGNNDAINIKNGKSHKSKRKKYKQFENIAPAKEYFSELKRVSKNQIIWGGNYFGLKGGYICWNKEGTVFGEAELAYCSMFNSVRIYKYTWNGMIQEHMKNKEIRIHPTQKPVQLYRWLLEKYAKEGDKIIDTHFGSGSIAIACWDLKLDLTAYEIDKEYFDIAIKRLSEHKQQLQLY